MTLALDDMVGALLDHLEQTGKVENTLVVFTSDHASQDGLASAGRFEMPLHL